MMRCAGWSSYFGRGKQNALCSDCCLDFMCGVSEDEKRATCLEQKLEHLALDASHNLSFCCFLAIYSQMQ
eukprot:3700223-Amphidinium_carterae.1